MSNNPVIIKALAEANARLAMLKQQASIYEGVIMGQGYIVVLNGRGMQLDIANKVVVGYKAVGIEHATLLTQQDAFTVASSTKHGNGNFARAAHITIALADAITELKAFIAEVEAM